MRLVALLVEVNDEDDASTVVGSNRTPSFLTVGWLPAVSQPTFSASSREEDEEEVFFRLKIPLGRGRGATPAATATGPTSDVGILIDCPDAAANEVLHETGPLAVTLYAFTSDHD